VREGPKKSSAALLTIHRDTPILSEPSDISVRSIKSGLTKPIIDLLIVFDFLSRVRKKQFFETKSGATMIDPICQNSGIVKGPARVLYTTGEFDPGSE
jgi:hypothetical protein